MTAMMTTGPAAVHQFAGDQKVKLRKVIRELMKAWGQIPKFFKGNNKGINEEELEQLNKFAKAGWMDAQLTRDALGKMEGNFDQTRNNLMDLSMKMFGYTETWNRASTFLAGYRVAKMAGKNKAAAFDSARDATNKAHGLYGKGTLPAWAQGTNPLAKIGQMFYVYKKFSHNLIQMLYDLGFRQRNIKGAVWLFGSQVVLGGTASIPFKSVGLGIMAAMLKAMGDDRDPEKMFMDGVRRHFGDTTERGVRYGLTGWLLNADISGSLSIDIDTSPQLIDTVGAIGGVYNDLRDTMYYFRTGQGLRALEVGLPVGVGNIFRSFRETEGITTRRGRPVFDARDRLFKPTFGESVKRAAGLRSARVATAQSRTYESKKEKTGFADRRSRIYEMYRSYLQNKDLRKYRQVVKLMKEYNRELAKSGRGSKIPKITPESLKRQAKAFKNPPKSERR